MLAADRLLNDLHQFPSFFLRLRGQADLQRLLQVLISVDQECPTVEQFLLLQGEQVVEVLSFRVLVDVDRLRAGGAHQLPSIRSGRALNHLLTRCIVGQKVVCRGVLDLAQSELASASQGHVVDELPGHFPALVASCRVCLVRHAQNLARSW